METELVKITPLRVGTDCSGIEAPIQALLQSNIPFHHVWSCEVDKYAIQTCKANYPEPIVRYSDINTRDHSTLPDIDLYVCGFPCQSFSGAGKRLGLEDAKGTIMFQCIEVIKVKQPKYFILENVRGFMGDKKGATMQLLLDSLNELGYTVHHKLLNTKDFGLPQNRPRVYFVGIRNDLKQSFSFPSAPMKSVSLDSVLTSREYDHNYKQNAKSVDKHILNYYQKHGNNPGDNLVIAPCNFGNAMNGVSPTLTTSCGYYMTKYNRRLSPIECMKLQGFPEDFKQVVSNTQFYKQAGNSMSVPILKCLISQLY